jgi:Vitamin K-dependent gamma-carboxylase
VSIDQRWLARILVIISALLGNTYVVPRGVPFVSFLSSVGSDRIWLDGLHFGVIAGTVLVFTPAWRCGSILVGTSWTVAVLGNMGAFSNGRLFQGFLLILCGLATTELGLTLLRAQIVLLYAGAALSKAIDRDWWNGRFIATLWEYHRSPLDQFAINWIARPVGIVTIFAETAIALTLVLARYRNTGVLLSIVFHSLTVVALNEDFATFSYAVVLATGVLFAKLPAVRAVQLRFRFLQSMSPFEVIRSSRPTPGPMRVDLQNGSLRGVLALGFLCLVTMPGQLAVFGLAAASSRVGATLIRDTLFCALIIFSVMFARTAYLDSHTTK